MLHKKIPLVKSNKVEAKLFVRVKLSANLLSGFRLTGLAQESVNVTGEDASGSGSSVVYPVRQVAHQTHTEANIDTPQFSNSIRFMGAMVF